MGLIIIVVFITTAAAESPQENKGGGIGFAILLICPLIIICVTLSHVMLYQNPGYAIYEFEVASYIDDTQCKSCWF